MTFQKINFYIFMFLLKGALSSSLAEEQQLENQFQEKFSEIKVLLKQEDKKNTCDKSYMVLEVAISEFTKAIQNIRQEKDNIKIAKEKEAENLQQKEKQKKMVEQKIKSLFYEKHFAKTTLFVKEPKLSFIITTRTKLSRDKNLDINFNNAIFESKECVKNIMEIIPYGVPKSYYLHQNKCHEGNTCTICSHKYVFFYRDTKKEIKEKLNGMYDYLFIQIKKLHSLLAEQSEKMRKENESINDNLIDFLKKYTSEVKENSVYDPQINLLFDNINEAFFKELKQHRFTNENRKDISNRININKMRKYGEKIENLDTKDLYGELDYGEIFRKISEINSRYKKYRKKQKKKAKERNVSEIYNFENFECCVKNIDQVEKSYNETYRDINPESILKLLEKCKLETYEDYKGNENETSYSEMYKDFESNFFSSLYKTTAKKEIDKFFNQHPEYMEEAIKENSEALELEKED